MRAEASRYLKNLLDILPKSNRNQAPLQELKKKSSRKSEGWAMPSSSSGRDQERRDFVAKLRERGSVRQGIADRRRLASAGEYDGIVHADIMAGRVLNL